jgi:hypothetical protein
MTQYNFAVYVQMRDEDNLIPFFVEHYLKLNFEHIYIIDDCSKNPIKDIKSIQPYIFNKRLSVYELNFDKDDYLNCTNKFMESKYYQKDLYINANKYVQKYMINYFVSNFKNENKWVFFCDADEFLYLQDFDTIQEFMSFHLEKNNNTLDGILFQWVKYGTSYHQTFPTNGHLFENFVLCDPNLHVWTKYIADINKILYADVHYFNSLENNTFLIKPNCKELIKKQDFESTYHKLNMDHKVDKLIKYTEMHAFIAHYIILDMTTFFKRKVTRFRNSRPTDKNDIKYHILCCDDFNKLLNLSMCKYIKQSNTNNPIEPNHSFSLLQYNQLYNTNFTSRDDMYIDFYKNNRTLILN